MAATCADCRTANRDGAKFCRGCGHRLRLAPPVNAAETRSDIDEDWPATQRMPMRREADRVDDAPAPAAPSQSGDRRPNAESSPPIGATARETGTNRIGAWSLLTAILIVGGGWSAFSSRITNSPANIPSSPPVVQPAPAAVIPAPEPPPVELSPPPQPEPQVVPPQATPAPPPVTPPKMRKAAPARIATPLLAVAQPVAPALAPAPEPAAPTNPRTACDGLNFFARARCMAAQCAKADYKAHPQCDAVRRQQQIDEEKRNPSLIG